MTPQLLYGPSTLKKKPMLRACFCMPLSLYRVFRQRPVLQVVALPQTPPRDKCMPSVTYYNS